MLFYQRPIRQIGENLFIHARLNGDILGYKIINLLNRRSSNTHPSFSWGRGGLNEYLPDILALCMSCHESSNNPVQHWSWYLGTHNWNNFIHYLWCVTTYNLSSYVIFIKLVCLVLSYWQTQYHSSFSVDWHVIVTMCACGKTLAVNLVQLHEKINENLWFCYSYFF